jgi:hypothetical protein
VLPPYFFQVSTAKDAVGTRRVLNILPYAAKRILGAMIASNYAEGYDYLNDSIRDS